MGRGSLGRRNDLIGWGSGMHSIIRMFPLTTGYQDVSVMNLVGVLMWCCMCSSCDITLCIHIIIACLGRGMTTSMLSRESDFIVDKCRQEQLLSSGPNTEDGLIWGPG